MLVRRIARPMLAAPFVVLGVDALRHPEKRASTAQPVVEKVAEVADRALPVEVPHEPEQWVQINAGVMVGAGTLYALGKLPRLCALLLTGSLVPTTLAGHPFWDGDTPQSRAEHQIHFLKNLGLLGGPLLAAADTQGQPGLRYRTSHAVDRSQRSVKRAVRTARREAKIAAISAAAARKMPG